MKLLFASAICLLLLSGSIAGQKTNPVAPPVASPDQCRIAFYTRDSIAIQFAEAKPKYESIQKSHDKLNSIREQLIPATDRYLTAKSDSFNIRTKEGYSDLLDAEHDLSVLRKDSLAEEQNIVKQYQLLATTYKKVDRVADSIGKARGVKQTRESADNSAMICPTDQMLMIDITNDIALAMGVKPKLAKIGIYNMDSLLRTLPGYAVISDSCKAERLDFETKLANKEKIIAWKQQELDSLRKELSRKEISNREKELVALIDDRDTYRGNELYRLDTKDSLRCSVYKVKFYKALNEVHRSAGCSRSYEYADAHALWKPEEAEFIDLNNAIAGKLK